MRIFQKLGIYAAVGAIAFAGSTFTAGSSNAAEKWVLGSIVPQQSSHFRTIT